MGLAGLLSALPLGAQVDAKSLPWHGTSERVVPEALDRALDIRWAEADAVLLAVVGTGAVRLDLSDPDASPFSIEISDGDGKNDVWVTSMVARTPDDLVAASPLFTIGWRGDDGGLRLDRSLEGIEDLDAHRDEIAVLGFRRDSEGEIAPDGVIAWQGSLSADEMDLRPLHVSSAGSGAKPFDSCANFKVGAIRYLPDGSIVVSPGAEPGIFLYRPDGRLAGTWDTERLGIGIDCSFDDRRRNLYSGDPHARWSYVAQFQTVDEIVPVGGRPGLIVRKPSAAGTRWDLILLDDHGETSERIPLPWTSPSHVAHLKGDVRDGRWVFLLFDEAIFLSKSDPKRRNPQRPTIFLAESAQPPK